MKYNKKDLKEMAGILLVAKRSNDDRYLKFVFNMMLETNLDAATIDRKITEFANS